MLEGRVIAWSDIRVLGVHHCSLCSAGVNMRSVLCSAALAAGALLFTSHAQAATVEVIQAKVSVNAGKGFVRVTGSAAVRPGNSVMAGPGGSAEIVYDNGCRQRVEPGSVAVVQQNPQCEVEAIPDDHAALTGLLVVGGVVGGVIAIHKSGHDHAASDE